MKYRRFVQPGALVRICYGAEEGKLATIAEIIDQKRVLIDGPTTAVKRQQIPLKRLLLTKFRLKDVKRGVNTKDLREALEKDNVVAQFYETPEGKKLLGVERRKTLTDFERFKVMIVRQKRARLMKKILGGQ